MAIRRFSEKKLTGEVLYRIRNTKNPRLKQVMTSFIRHMHGFVRDVKPTQEEWFKGIQFLTETGHWSTGKRQEFILMSDTLGVSMLVDALNYKAGRGTTESTVLGPFHRLKAPQYPLGRQHREEQARRQALPGHGHRQGRAGQAGARREARRLAGGRRRLLRFAEGQGDEPARHLPRRREGALPFPLRAARVLPGAARRPGRPHAHRHRPPSDAPAAPAFLDHRQGLQAADHAPVREGRHATSTRTRCSA